MIIGLESAPFINELGRDLNQKTLELASERLGHKFERVVPWMCMVCLSDTRVEDTSIFFEEYERGEMLVDTERLRNIARFLENDGKTIAESIFGPKTGLHSADHWFSVVEDFEGTESVWTDCYAKAREMVLSSDEFFPAVFPTLVHVVVPMNAFGKFAFSTHLARGVVFFTAPEPSNAEVTMAIDLAHEMGHQALMLFQSADSLLESPLDQPVWSAIRKTERPAIQCMQAASALAFMIVFVKGALKNARLDAAQTEVLRKADESLASGMKATLAGLKDNCKFTPVGQRLISEFSQLVEL